MGEGQNIHAPTGGLFHFQNCNFPKESVILISFCNSAREYVKNRLSNKRRRYFQLNPAQFVKLSGLRKRRPFDQLKKLSV
jgi:hypothetical protein